MDCSRCSHPREDHGKVGCDHKDGFGRLCLCWWFESKPRLGANMRRQKSVEEDVHPSIRRIFGEQRPTMKQRLNRVPTLLKFAAAALAFLLIAAAKPMIRKAPAVVILCEFGGVSTNKTEGSIAFGGNCVLHDRTSATSSGSIVVYNNEGAP